MKKSYLLVAALAAIVSVQSAAANARDLRANTVTNVLASCRYAVGYSLDSNREVTVWILDPILGEVGIPIGGATQGQNAQQINKLCKGQGQRVPVQGQDGRVIY